MPAREARIRALQAALASQGDVAAERARAQATLKSRAEALATVRQVERPGKLEELLSFTLGAEKVAVETRAVIEVVKRPRLVPLPGAPAFVSGMALVHGQPVTVLRPQVALSRPTFGSPDENAAPYLVALGRGRAELGLLVEELGEVSAWDLTPLQPSVGADVVTPYLRGIFPDGTLLLDAPALLEDSTLYVS